MQNRILTEELILSYSKMLQTNYSRSTKERYQRDVTDFYHYAQGCEINPEVCARYEEKLKARYRARSVRTIVNGLNTFFGFAKWNELRMRPSRFQPGEETYKEPMTLTEYGRLLEEARKKGDWRLSLLMETLCTLHLKVSEHPLVTREALSEGSLIVVRKDSCCILQVPEKLRQKLEKYCQVKQITHGPVFQTSHGRIYDRSNIYRDMKRLCPGARVQTGKVTPQQLLNLNASKNSQIKQDNNGRVTKNQLRAN